MSTPYKDGRKEKRRREDPEHGEGDAVPDVRTRESGGELSMSIEETNKLRVSLGLKPLSLDSSRSKQESRPAASKDKETAPTGKASADELREKIKQSRDKRRSEQLLATKSLGAKDDAEEDVYAWVQKSRQGGSRREEDDSRPSKSTRRGKRHKDRGRHREEDGEDEDEEGMRYTAEELAGMKVRHDYKDLDDGEMMVLTLADKGILDEKGDLLEDGEDELENVLKAEEKRRKKARDASQKKAKPLWEEDGKRRTLLDKYDEEEEDMIRLGDEAAMEARRQHVREEVRKKLAASAGQLEASNAMSDYYTKEEAATLFKKKKRKKVTKQLRQKPKEEEGEVEDTAALMEALEAEAEVQQDGKPADLGKRGARITAHEKAAAEEAARVLDRRERFDKALQKANWASLSLKNDKQESDGADEEEEGDRELYESLARARRAAAREASRSTPLENVAEVVAKKREEDEAKLKLELNSQSGGLEITETREFIHSIQPLAEEPIPRISGSSKTPLPGQQSIKMEVDDKPSASATLEASKDSGQAKYGKWVSAEKNEHREDMHDDMVGSDEEEEGKNKPPEMQEAGLTGEKVIGRGLAACLGLLKEKGELKQKLEWAGRTNDKKKTQVMGLEDVYTGGSAEDRLALGIEVALTQRDEYGRILTPKERFRELSYRFHGKTPSKNKQEKRMKQAEVEIARRKASTSESPGGDLEQMKKMQAKTGAAFVVLQGKDNKMQSSSSKSSKAPPASSKTTMKTPVLGGGYTPLTDPQRKVQAMYGISKPGDSSSMLPPPPRRPPPSA